MTTAQSLRSRVLTTGDPVLGRSAGLEQAACRVEDPGLFFPSFYGPSGGDKRRVAKAKEVCARCPVVTECLVTALTRREPDGVWGGLTPGERRRVLRDVAALRRPATAIVARIESGSTFPAAGADIEAVVHALSREGGGPRTRSAGPPAWSRREAPHQDRLPEERAAETVGTPKADHKRRPTAA